MKLQFYPWTGEEVDGGWQVHLECRGKKKANKQTGSSFNEPIFNFPCKKQNSGIMHDTAGHITHFMNKVSDSSRKRMVKST